MPTRTSAAARRLDVRRTAALISDERGASLVIVVVMVAALSLMTASLATLVTSNTKAFGRDRQESRALNSAEAGLNYGVSRLTQYDPTGALAVGSTLGSATTPQTFTLDGGSGAWWAAKTAADLWTVHSRGTSPNGQVEREVAIDTTVGTTITTGQPSLAYGYGYFIASPSSCTSITGSSAITANIYINGDACMSGSTKINEATTTDPKTTTVYIAGLLTVSSTAGIGTPTRGVKSATIVGGCKNGSAVICSNSALSQVYADTYGSAPQSLTKPPVDFAATYALGDWNHPTCTVGTFVFDTNGSRDAGRGQWTPFTASSYDCTVYNTTHTAVVGRMAWNSTTKAFTVSGILFVDGKLSVSNPMVNYTGTGTIYVNGDIALGGGAVCGPGDTAISTSACSGAWNPSAGALGLVGATKAALSSTSQWDMLLYVVGDYSSSGASKVMGPVIANSGSISGGSGVIDVTNVPTGMPGGPSAQTTTTWTAKKGTWRQVPVSG